MLIINTDSTSNELIKQIQIIDYLASRNETQEFVVEELEELENLMRIYMREILEVTKAARHRHYKKKK